MKNIFFQFIFSKINKTLLIFSILPACIVPFVYHFVYAGVTNNINNGFAKNTLNDSFVIQSLIYILLLLLSFQILHFISSLFLSRCISDIRSKIKNFLFEKIVKVDIIEIKNHDTSSVEKEFTEFSDSVSEFIRIIIQNVLPFILSVVSTILTSYHISSVMCYFFIGWAILFFVVWILYTKHLHRAHQEYSQSHANEGDIVAENIRNLSVNQIFPDSFNINKDIFQNTINETNRKFAKAIVLIGLYRLVLGMVNGILFAGFVYILFIHSKYISAVNCTFLFGSASRFIVSIWEMMNSGLPLCHQIGRILSLHTIVSLPERQNGDQKITSIKSIEIKNLNYKYGSKQVFNNFNLKINKSDTILLKGGSGSGKSTLISLISGIRTAPDKTIFINGIDINQIDRSSLISNISLMTQNDMVFHDSIKNNVMRGNENLTSTEFDQIARQCYLDNLGLDMSHMCGYQGAYISGGQRQMITLARTLAKTNKKNRPSLLMIDEVFAGCSENVIEQTINTLKEFKDKNMDSILLLCDHSENSSSLNPRIIKIS